MEEELLQVLKDYVATANNSKYGGNWETINSKFPELKSYDPQLLKDYVATANNSKYGGNWETINSKFPEFNGSVKKKRTYDSFRTFYSTFTEWWSERPRYNRRV